MNKTMLPFTHIYFSKSGIILTVSILLLLSLASGLSAANDPDRPNVIFITVDQQRFDFMTSVMNEMSQYNGKAKVRTPNMDRLRNEGAIFRNFYTHCAVCGPARGVYRSGKTLENNGIQSNGLTNDDTFALDPLYSNKVLGLDTFDMLLVEEQGYIAEQYGKWHIPKAFNYSRDGSFRIMNYNDAHYTAMSSNDDYANVIFSFDHDKPSLEYSEKVASVVPMYAPGPGEQVNTYSKFPYTTLPIDVRHDEAPGSATAVAQPDQQGRNTLPWDKTSSYFLGTAQVAAIDRLAQGNDPFIVSASFHSPHAPFVSAPLYHDYYDALKDNFFMPPSYRGDHLDNSAYKVHTDPDYQNEEMIRDWMVTYYALVEEVDVYVGKILDKLDEHGIADNTFVICTSDHGEMLGSHGMREKNKFLEESAHVTMLVRYPPKVPAGLVIDEVSSSLDIYATILDYCNLSHLDNGDGKSLRRFIERTHYNKDYDDEHIVTEWDFRTPKDTDGDGVSNGLERNLGSETNFLSMKYPWKLMMTKLASSNRLDMLYNLEDDPFEMNNLVGNNGMTASDEVIGKAEHLKALLGDWMTRLDYNGNYSDPIHNEGVGTGDINEIKIRRKWKKLDIWVCDTDIEVGVPANVGGQWTRNEYIYFGRTTNGTLNISSVTVEGADAPYLQLSGFTSGNIVSGDYEKVKLTYLPNSLFQEIQDARIVIRHNAGADKVINLSSATPSIQEWNAAFVSQNIPTSMTPGDTFPAQVVMNNNGFETWTNTAEVKLGTQNPQGNSIWTGANRVLLPGDVASGEDAVFNFDITAPTEPGMYNFQWRVLQEGVRWFGDYTENVSVNVGYLYDTTSDAGTISDNGVNPPASESSAEAIDDDTNTKFLSFSNSAYLQYQYAANERKTVVAYSVTSANDVPDRDPVDLVLSGSNDGVNWNLLDSRSGVTYPERFYTNAFNVTNSTAYEYYRLEMSNNGAVNILQVAEIELFAEGNAPPVITSTPANTAEIGIEYSYTMTGSDYNNDSLQFSAVSLPSWLSYNAGTQVLSGTANVSNYGEHIVVLRVSDGLDQVDQVFAIAVSNQGNDAPVISSVPETGVIENNVYSYVFAAADPDLDSISFVGTDVPDWLNFNQDTGRLSGTPTPAHVGMHLVTLSAGDGVAVSEQSFNIMVFSTPLPDNVIVNPSFEEGGVAPNAWSLGSASSGSMVTAAEGTTQSLAVSTGSSPTKQTAIITPNTNYNISVWINASGLSQGSIVVDTQDVFDGAGQGQFVVDSTQASTWTEFTGSFNSGPEGSITMRIFANGGATPMTGTAYVDHLVISPEGAGNSVPVITSIPVTEVSEGSSYSYRLLAADAEGTALAFSAVAIPNWLTFDPQSGLLSGTTMPGTYPVALQASDGEDSATQSFSITVNSTIDLDADDDNDGIINRLELALGGDPNVADADTVLPQVTVAGPTIDIGFKREQSSVTYTIQKSTDLVSWEDHTTVTDTHGAVGENATVPVSVTEMNNGKLFLRLKVEN